eukprot:jgi/Chrzof1/9718/Cz04g13090.t1
MSNTPQFAKRRPKWQLRGIDLDLQLDADDVLQQAAARQACPNCQRSRSLFCYDCLLPFTPVPHVKLPFKVSIIRHHAEAASKNTGVHAALISPKDVILHSIHDCPEFTPNKAAVLFPSADAVEPGDLDVDSLERIFIMDSKWAKAKDLLKTPVFNGVQAVKLPAGIRSCFWRFHTSGVAEEGVCTIEALYHLLKSLHASGKLKDQDHHNNPHCYDNLLWYFAHQHRTIQEAAATRQQKRLQQTNTSAKHPSSKQANCIAEQQPADKAEIGSKQQLGDGDETSSKRHKQ